MATRLTGDQITVAVATCGRPASLARCLEALAKSTTRPRETIVVDQAPSPDSRQVVEQCGIEGALIYLEQPRLGTSAARNLALATASGVVLATIDDDCAPDPGWVSALAAAFERDPRPVAVTGPVLALGPRPPGSHAISLRTDARAVDYGGRMLPWIAGGGGNFAAWRDVLRHHAGWDERLGPGSRGQSSEDSDLLYRILRDGGVVRYEPAAVVRHEWQTWARRLATRSSYGHGRGALCGLWLRRGDAFALRMLAAYAKNHVRALAGAARRRNRGETIEQMRALTGLLPGLLYGVLARRRGEPSGLTYRSKAKDEVPTDTPNPRLQAQNVASRPAFAIGPSDGASPAGQAPAETDFRHLGTESIATLLLTVSALLVVLVDWQSPVRTVIALGFLLFAPGLALAEMLAIHKPTQRLALVAGASLALETVVALTLVYAGAFSIDLAVILLAGLTIAALALAFLRVRKPFVKSRDRQSHI